MTPRRWENIAKYFFDLSKLTFSIAVVTQLFTKQGASWKQIALGTGTGLFFFLVAWIFDQKGGSYDQR